MIVYAVSKGLTSGNNLNKRINRYKRGPSQHFASQAGRQRGWWNVGRDSIPDGHGSRRPNFACVYGSELVLLVTGGAHLSRRPLNEACGSLARSRC